MKPSVNSNTSNIVRKMTAKLKEGNFTEAVNLFIMGQNHGIFIGDHTLIQKLTKVIGKNATSRLVTAFAHYPCPYCKKGRSKCQSCEGHGHIDEDMICEQCFGLGVVRCDFCDGSGWMAIEDVPEGLHLTVLIKRIQTALVRMRLILGKTIPKPSENSPSMTIKKCAKLLINLDRYMGVFENTITAVQTMNIKDGRFKNKFSKIIMSCIENAIKAKKYKWQIIQCMAVSAKLASKATNEDLSSKKLMEKRSEFYKSLLDQSNALITSSDEHPFLEKAIKRYKTNCLKKK